MEGLTVKVGEASYLCTEIEEAIDQLVDETQSPGKSVIVVEVKMVVMARTVPRQYGRFLARNGLCHHSTNQSWAESKQEGKVGFPFFGSSRNDHVGIFERRFFFCV